MISLLCHDIGYVRGVCRGDRDGHYVSGENGKLVPISAGATDASLTPYHVARSKLFVRERFGKHHERRREPGEHLMQRRPREQHAVARVKHERGLDDEVAEREVDEQRERAAGKAADDLRDHVAPREGRHDHQRLLVARAVRMCVRVVMCVIVAVSHVVLRAV